MTTIEIGRETSEPTVTGVHMTDVWLTTKQCGILIPCEPPRAPNEADRRLQEDWLAACERNQGYAPGTHPIRVALARHRALGSRTGADQAGEGAS